MFAQRFESVTGRINCQAMKSRTMDPRTLAAAIKEAVSSRTPKIIDPDKLLAVTSRDISQALWFVQSKSTSPEQREAAIHLIRSIFAKCSWIMRRLVVDIETPDILQQFVAETYSNCGLLQNAERIHRKRIKEIAREMPNFPILQSAGSQLRQRARLFLREIDLGGPGGRGSTRRTNTVFMWAARQITLQLNALLKTIPYLLNHPDAECRLDKDQLEPAYQNALDFFKSINFDISGDQWKQIGAVNVGQSRVKMLL
jgi:hypothetical protein